MPPLVLAVFFFFFLTPFVVVLPFELRRCGICTARLYHFLMVQWFFFCLLCAVRRVSNCRPTLPSLLLSQYSQLLPLFIYSMVLMHLLLLSFFVIHARFLGANDVGFGSSVFDYFISRAEASFVDLSCMKMSSTLGQCLFIWPGLLSLRPSPFAPALDFIRNQTYYY